MADALPQRQEYGTLRKAAFGRTDLFLASSSAVFKEIRCSASFNTRKASASIFHAHGGNNSPTKPDGCVCWHCCHAYDGVGFRLPRLFDPSESVYHVYGWFCSANCAKAYILEHSTFDRGYQMNVFVRMLREVYGIEEPINEAPPRTALKLFGGPFDIEDFQKQKNVCMTVTPPFVSYCMLVEERQPVATIGESSSTMQRGSVRGLRRPADVPVPKASDDDICGPPPEGLYANFLRRESTHAADEGSSVPAAKRPRSKITKPANGATSGLAKFAAPAKGEAD